MIGVCILSGRDWEEWQLPALQTWRPDVVRLQIAYDNHPDWLSLTEQQIRDLESCLSVGSTVIIRGCETKIDDKTFLLTLNSPFKDGSLTLLQWIQEVCLKYQIILEVGNEPDLGNAPVWGHRWHLLNTIKVCKPFLPATVQWGVSLATQEEYNRILFLQLVDGGILTEYDCLMPHCYGHNSFAESDGARPRAILHQAQVTGKPLWITEFGINSPNLTWVQKAKLYKEFISSANVEGGTLFALSTDPEWVSTTHYGIDITPDQVRDTKFNGIKTLTALPMKELTKMGNVPKPNITTSLITKTPGIGRDSNDRQRVPKFTVLHSMVGTLEGTNSYFRQPTVAALTDFGVGLADTGNGYAKIYQWNDFHGTQIGWASGPVIAPFGDGPAILAKFGGAAGLNQFGVSIEHDDSGNVNTPVSAAQWSATVWLQAWIHAEEIGQTASTFAYNAHHREFCGTAYKDCPGHRIYDYTDEYQNAIKAVMRHWQEGVPYPTAGVFVNGKKLTVPTNGGTTVPNSVPTSTSYPALAAGKWRVYINAKGETVAEFNFGGFATEIEGIEGDFGVNVKNGTAKYHRSWTNDFVDWIGV